MILAAVHIANRAWACGATIRVHQDDPGSVPQDRNIRVMGHKDQLPGSLNLPDALDHGTEHKAVIEVVLRLID